jgi:hypothetical protein
MRQKTGMRSAEEQSRDRYPALTIRARDALRGVLATHSPTTLLDNRKWPPSLREPLVALCASSRRDGDSAEQLLICVKQAWWSLPQQRRALGDCGSEVLSRIVTACIEEFYRADNPERAD